MRNVISVGICCLMWSAQPPQRARMVGSGSVWRHCSMGCKCRNSLVNVISFSAAISACEMGSYM
eukprot:238240-Karenia_brevis.AAC.1